MSQININNMKQENYDASATEIVEASETMTHGLQDSCNTNMQTSYAQASKDMKAWGSVKNWTEQMWQEFQELIEAELSGEDLMKAFGFKRRKELEAIFYQLSLRMKMLHTINWLVDYENNEHTLPDLKSGKDGLRISNTRFKRHGFDIPSNTYFEMKKISETELKLIIRYNN